jgi:hypothetical protein
MNSDVEAVAVGDDRAADAADDVVGLEHGGGTAALAQLVGGGQPGGSGADDDDVSGRGRGFGGGVGHGAGAISSFGGRESSRLAYAGARSPTEHARR